MSVTHGLRTTLGALVFLAGSAWAIDWQPLPIPDRTEGEWVLGDAMVNGVPMQVQRLHSRLSVPQMLEYYENQWKRWGSVRRTQASGWQSLAVTAGTLQLTLQVQEASGGSEAILSQAAWTERRRDFLPTELPDLPRTEAHQVTETHDGPKRSRLVQLASEDDLELNRQRWQSHARRKGWTLVTEKQLKQAGQKHWLASYSSAGALTLDLVLTQADAERKTHITANFLDATP